MLTEDEQALARQALILQQCATWIDEGKLRIHLSQTFPLSEAATAHKTLESGSMMGKVALLIE